MYRKFINVFMPIIGVQAFNLLVLSVFLLPSEIVFSQVGIGTDHPAESSILELNSEDKGLLVPRVENSDKIEKPLAGMIIYNKKASCLQGYSEDSWIDLTECGYSPGNIDDLDIKEEEWLSAWGLNLLKEVNSVPFTATIDGKDKEYGLPYVFCGITIGREYLEVLEGGTNVIKFSRPVTNMKMRIYIDGRNSRISFTSNNDEANQPKIRIFGKSNCKSKFQAIENAVISVDDHPQGNIDINIGGKPYTELKISNKNGELFRNTINVVFSFKDAVIM